MCSVREVIASIDVKQLYAHICELPPINHAGCTSVPPVSLRVPSRVPLQKLIKYATWHVGHVSSRVPMSRHAYSATSRSVSAS